MHARPSATDLATGLAILVAASTATAQTPATAPITTAEAAMRYHLSLEYKTPPLRMWTQPHSATCSVTGAGAHAESADTRLNQIVRSHTREMLDRGAWVSPCIAPDQRHTATR